jgi:hypothetical protein
MCNKARVEGCIAKAFTCKEIMNFSTMYFSHANNVNAHMMRYRIVEEFPLSELKIFQLKGKGVGACTAHFVVDYEWNYTMLYMYMIMEEVEPYFDNFDKMYWKSREQPTTKQLDDTHEHGKNDGPNFVKWFHQYVIYLPALYFVIIY